MLTADCSQLVCLRDELVQKQPVCSANAFGGQSEVAVMHSMQERAIRPPCSSGFRLTSAGGV